MADNRILRPHRGKASTMAGSRSHIVLDVGELFVELPDTGVGTGESKIKIGDGKTQYKDLPYAIGDVSNNTIKYSSNTSTNVANALNNVASGKKLGEMIAGLKQAITLMNSNTSSELSDIKDSFQDGCNTIVSGCTTYGVTPASNSATDIANAIKKIYTEVCG